MASPTPRLHRAFIAAIGETPEEQDPSDRLLDVETQLGWLREHSFEDVDVELVGVWFVYGAHQHPHR